MEIDKKKLLSYLNKKFGEVKLNKIELLGRGVYGIAYLIDFDSNQGKKRLVLKTMGTGGFGHDHFSDIAGIMIWENACYSKLPKHVKAYDVLGLEPDGDLVSIGDSKEFYILVEEATGKPYAEDLNSLLTRELTPLDEERVNVMAEYLAEIHSKKKSNPQLYVRRTRDMVGHGECIMGVLDGYDKTFPQEAQRVELVKNCVEWWSKLKTKTHRLSQVHGDFHPFNILFQEGSEFVTLDRSRGEYGEPADDTTALTVNYIFWSLVKHGKLAGDYEKLFKMFYETYFEKTKDEELLEVLPLFYAFRLIVVANPTFYPDKWFKEKNAILEPIEIRKKLYSLANNMLKTKKVELDKINSYMD
ncbi:aminoglycoside phosphotransferase family protein [archaeon]|nr:aminoglycoside phosphotransferase family protein [archaeon]